MCPEYDEATKTCKLYGFKFYEGMKKPCDYVTDPKKCPRALM